jgi:hypothetical protein
MALTKPQKINVAVAIVSGLGALVGVAVYFEGKRTRQLQAEVLSLDKEIKEIQLKQIKR